MASRQASHRPIRLVLDWDSTLTNKDTMSILADIPKVRDNGFSSTMSEAPPWDSFFNAYMDDYRAHKAAHYPQSQEVSHEECSRWLQSLDAVELASSRRVSDSGFFKGTKSQHVHAVASQALLSGQLKLRTGWQALLESFLPRNNTLPANSSLSILSVHFSATFIRSALRCSVASSTGTSSSEREKLATMVNDMIIQANEIEGLDLPEGSSGRLISSIRTAQHKLARLSTLCQTHSAEKPLVVYVGDSATDYECLRAADLGIWIYDCPESHYQEKFVQIFKPLSLDAFRPIPIDSWEGQHVFGKTCLWTPSLAPVVQLLMSLNSHTPT